MGEGTGYKGVIDDYYGGAGYKGVKKTQPYIVRVPGGSALAARFETAVQAAVGFARQQAGLPAKPEAEVGAQGGIEAGDADEDENADESGAGGTCEFLHNARQV